MDALPLNRPEVFVTQAQDKFHANRLVDPVALELVAKAATSLVEWTQRLAR